MAGTKEVFQLRREGRIEEALQLARQLYAASPSDPWATRSLFWSLHSAWKECQDSDSRGGLAREILDLPVASDDNMAQNALRAVQRSQDPSAPAIAQAKDMSKTGRHDEAAAVLEQFLRKFPGNPAAESALAWETWWRLGGLLKVDAPSAGDVASLIRRYAQLRSIERPSMIHSRMLEAAARAARAGVFPRFGAFLHWWGYGTNLRTEDHVGQTNAEGHAFPSVVQHVIYAIGKTIEEEGDATHLQVAVDFMRAHVPHYEGDEWVPYFMGIALCKIGEREEALTRLIPFARTKNREFWVWQKLAGCFAVEDERHLACLCRSVMCGAKGPEFLLTVRLQLAVALHAAGHHDEARYEVESVVRIRQQHGWKIGEDLLRLQNERWFAQAVGKENVELIRRLSAPADEVLMSGIPWTNAMLQATDVQGERGLSAIVLIDTGGKHEAVRVHMRVLGGRRDLGPGSPMSVRMSADGGHMRILDVRPREGAAWDLLPEICAVVTRVNTERGITSLLAASGETILAHHGDLPDASGLGAGDFVFTRSSPGRDVRHAQTLRACDPPPASAYWKRYDGPFRPREKGGGHVGDVFIAGFMVDGREAGSRLHGVAVKQTGDRGDSWWAAVSVKSD